MMFAMRMKKILMTGMAFAVLGSFSAPCVADDSAMQDVPVADINDIKFPLGIWDPNLLHLIEMGPYILPLDTPFDVAPPPENSSELVRRELDYLLAVQDVERTEDEVARIQWEHKGKKAHQIFMNEGLLPDNNFKTDQLLTVIDADHSYFILRAKKHYARPRPSQLDERLTLVLGNPGHAAYPSGHSSQTYMVALVLSDFDPENGNIYKQFAYDVTHRREVAGFHYTSDSIAGRKLAVDVLAKLRENDVFEKKYQDAKASYVRPSKEVIDNYKAHIAARVEKVPLMPEVQAEWEEIGFIPE